MSGSIVSSGELTGSRRKAASTDAAVSPAVGSEKSVCRVSSRSGEMGAAKLASDSSITLQAP